MHGQFVWYELTTPDVDASKKFYPRFTEWGTQAFDKDYTMFTSGGVPRAGIFRLSDELRQQGVPPNWMPYIEVDDVDAAAKKAKSLGATVVVPPDDIPGTGRFAVLQDPQGATFGVYKSANMSNAWDGTPEVDRFSWHELMTTDYAKAFEFYRTLFRWNKNGEMDMGAGNMYLMWGHGESMYGGMFNTMPEMAGMPPFWLVYIHVKDVGKAVVAATKAGATVVRPRMDIPGGTIAILADPQGAGFALHDLMTMPVAATPVTATPVAAKVAKAGAGVKVTVKKAVTAVKKAAKKVAKKTSKIASGIKAKVKARVSRPGAAKPRTKGKPKAKARAGKVARKAPARARSSASTTSRTRGKSAARKSSRRPASKK